MPHCTPEQLALAALREPLPESDAVHLAGCAECRAEVRSLQRSVDVLAVPQLAAPGPPVAPPPRVWDAIAAATGVSAAPRPEAVAGSAPEAAPAREEPEPGAQVRELRPRRSRLLSAAAAALVVGAGIGAGAVALGSRSDDGTAVATTELDPLEGSSASGRAAVVERGDGSRVLDVELSAQTLEDAYYEVWLLEPGAQQMVSVGVIQGGEGRLELPPGLDLGAYPVVDVSVEPLDGDPTHSGVSVARGVLDS
ncbi:MAG TPA: anti-sigma factor [Geodermatophilus sp.]|nr:anti-sigma factor [Geodermatophilus sp.]